MSTVDIEMTEAQRQALARVTALDAELDPEQLGEDGQPLPPPAPPPDPGAENAAILSAIIMTLTPALPFLAQCYPPVVIQQIALAYTAVEEKRGWNARAFLSVEMQLAFVAIPPALQAIVLAKAYFRAKAIENKLPWWLKWTRKKTDQAGQREQEKVS